MAAVSTRTATLLALVALVPLVTASQWQKEVPVHHGGGGIRDHQDMRELRVQTQQYQYSPGNEVDRQSYAAPAPVAGGYQEQESDNLLTYILPALAITGLSLLFPNIVTINTSGRRRRDLGDSVSPAAAPMDDLVEHLTNIYYAATESDECIQRIVCEIGATAKVMKTENKNLMIKILGQAATKKYSKLFSRFEEGIKDANCKKIGCKLID